MFDIGFFEIVVIAAIALIVLGPERLPHALRMAGAWLGRLKGAMNDVREEINREMEIDEIKKFRAALEEKVGEDTVNSLRKDLENAKSTLEAEIGDTAQAIMHDPEPTSPEVSTPNAELPVDKTTPVADDTPAQGDLAQDNPAKDDSAKDHATVRK